MATPSVTYSFAASTLIESAKVNQNFTDLVNFLTNSVLHVDGSKDLTALLAQDAAVGDPSSDDQLTRKKYVDDKTWANAAMAFTFSNWTPTMSQNGSVTLTNTRSRYLQLGKLVIASFNLAITSNGSDGTDLTVGGLPVAAASTGFIYGNAFWRDADAGANALQLFPIAATTSTINFHEDGGNGVFDTGVENGDFLDGFLVYESA